MQKNKNCWFLNYYGGKNHQVVCLKTHSTNLSTLFQIEIILLLCTPRKVLNAVFLLHPKQSFLTLPSQAAHPAVCACCVRTACCWDQLSAKKWLQQYVTTVPSSSLTNYVLPVKRVFVLQSFLWPNRKKNKTHCRFFICEHQQVVSCAGLNFGT